MMIYFGGDSFGKNLHLIRRRKRLSLKKLSELTQIPYLTLYCIENGFLHDIDYDHLVSLCRTLRVTQEELTG